MTLPSETAFWMKYDPLGWFQFEQQTFFQSTGFVAAVCVLVGHSGLCIGKANGARAKGRQGHPERCAEHYKALIGFDSRRDFEFPRYASLRNSVGNIGFVPAVWYRTEVQALTVERAPIQMLRP
eukprot:3568178-Pyramimonas_sp.AAC.1